MTVARAAVAGSITTVAGSAGGGPALAVAQVPDAVAVHGAFIYVADYFSHVVWRLDTATGEEVVVAGTGGGTSFGGDGGPATAAQLGFPLGVAVDAAGNLAIADQSNDRIRLVNATTGVITTVAGKESSGFSGDGGPATAAELYLPAGVTFGAAGDLFIADQQNNRIRRVDATAGIITTVAGNGSAGFSGDGGPATAAQLQYPYSVTLDATGNIFISDGNDRIRRVDATTGIITTVAGNGSAGFSGDGGLATAAQLNAPSGVAFDAAQNLFIADRFNSRIRRVDAATAGSRRPRSSTPPLASPLTLHRTYSSPTGSTAASAARTRRRARSRPSQGTARSVSAATAGPRPLPSSTIPIASASTRRETSSSPTRPTNALGA